MALPPPRNQLTDDTNNRPEDCVIDSLAFGIQDMSGQNFDAATIKDGTYGAGYVGPTDPSHFVTWCADHGITLTRYTNYDQAGLVAALHSTVDKADCLVTIPSAWNTPEPVSTLHNPNFTTHVCCACLDLGAGGIRLMNPWGGIFQDWTDARLEQELCYATFWKIEKAAAPAGVPPMPGVPAGWRDDGTTLYGPPVYLFPNGVPVTLGFRSFIRSQNWDASNVPLAPEEGREQVLDQDGRYGAGDRQVFSKSVLIFVKSPDPALHLQPGGIYSIPAGTELVWLERNPPKAPPPPPPAPPVIQKPDLSAPIAELKSAVNALDSAITTLTQEAA